MLDWLKKTAGINNPGIPSPVPSPRRLTIGPALHIPYQDSCSLIELTTIRLVYTMLSILFIDLEREKLS